MALFTDGTISSLDEVRAYDSAVLDVASTEDIDVTAKLGLAQRQIELELTGLVGCSRLGNVVITEPLRQWHTLQTLSLVYVDAYYRQLNDRYSGKWTLYRDLAKRASETLFQIGIGSVDNPIGRPEAPEVTPMPGPLEAATYYVQVCWTNAEGQESSPSEAAVVSAPDGHILAARAMNPPPNAVGWTVYAGLNPEQTTLQNDIPLAIGEVWTEPASGLRNGKAAGEGQEPSSYLTLSRILQRG